MSRARMEARFGRVGAGARSLTIAGTAYSLADLMARLGIAFEGCKVIDGFELAPAHFAVRYYDADELHVVAYEFDGDFRYIREMRVHVAEWVGDEGLQEQAWTWTSS